MTLTLTTEQLQTIRDGVAPKVVWRNGAVSGGEVLAANLEGYSKIRPGADRDKFCMAAAAKFIRETIARLDPDTVRAMATEILALREQVQTVRKRPVAFRVPPMSPLHQFDCAATRGARKAALESHASMIPAPPCRNGDE